MNRLFSRFIFLITIIFVLLSSKNSGVLGQSILKEEIEMTAYWRKLLRTTVYSTNTDSLARANLLLADWYESLKCFGPSEGYLWKYVDNVSLPGTQTKRAEGFVKLIRLITIRREYERAYIIYNWFPYSRIKDRNSILNYHKYKTILASNIPNPDYETLYKSYTKYLKKSLEVPQELLSVYTFIDHAHVLTQTLKQLRSKRVKNPLRIATADNHQKALSIISLNVINGHLELAHQQIKRINNAKFNQSDEFERQYLIKTFSELDILVSLLKKPKYEAIEIIQKQRKKIKNNDLEKRKLYNFLLIFFKYENDNYPDWLKMEFEKINEKIEEVNVQFLVNRGSYEQKVFDKEAAVIYSIQKLKRAEEDKILYNIGQKNHQIKFNRWLYFFITSSVIILFLTIYQTRKYSKKITRSKQNLSRKIDTLHKVQNKKKKSISTAQAFQKSIIPSKKDLERYYSEVGIFYQPVSVVSGDFYWSIEKDDAYYIILCDCIGHGISGAFGTMAAHSVFIEVFNTISFEEFDLLLKKINLTFKEKYESNNQISLLGMDMSILGIRKETNPTKEKILKYSGAHIPLHIYRDNLGELSIIKPTRRGIGGTQNEKKVFKTECLKLQKNDLVIMTSDGFTDQLNDEEKKVTRKQYNELILNCVNEPISKQIETFKSFFNNRININKQLDDVLLMILKI